MANSILSAHFSSLIDSAIKAAILLLIAFGLCVALKRSSAAMRHLVWLAALAAALAMPILSFCLPHWRVLPVEIEASAPPQAALMPIQSRRTGSPQLNVWESNQFTPETNPNPQIDFAPVSNVQSANVRPTSTVNKFRFDPIDLLIIWIIGAGLMLVPLARGIWIIRRLRGRVNAIHDGPVARMIDGVANELHVDSPRAHFGARGAMPMVWGIFRGHILLPTEAADWSASQLRAVLLHELAHLRRRDPLTQLIGQLARALYWFNPLAWYALHRLKVEQERACDDFVLRGGIKASEYAGHVLEVATDLAPMVRAAAALAMAEPARIERRLNTILDAKCNRRPLSRLLVAATLTLAILAAVSVAILHPARAAENVGAFPLDTKGIVTDHLGQPIAGVTVELIRQRFVPQTTRAAAIDVISSTKSALGGAFQLGASVNLAQGEKIYLRGFADGKAYSTVLVQPDALPEQRYVDLIGRPTDSAWILLIPAKTIRGIVVDQSDRPIPNCEIGFPLIPRESVHSGIDGTFQIDRFPAGGDPLIPDRSAVEFVHPGFVAVRTGRAKLQQPDGSWRVILSKGVLLTGTMTDETNGRPLSGVSLSISGSNAVTSVYADALGKYSVRVPADQQLTITPLVSLDPSSPSFNFAPVGRYNQLKVRHTFAKDKETAELNFTFREGRTVSGQVKLPREIGHNELRIDVTPTDGSTPARAYAEKDGKFTVHGVRPGKSQISAIKEPFQSIHVVSRGTIEVADGQDLTGVEMSADLPAGGTPVSTFHGKVFNPDGTPAVLAQVLCVRGSDGVLGNVRDLTRLDGSFTLPGRSADVPFIVWVSTANQETAAAMEIPAGTEPALPLEVHLLPSSRIGGRILDAAGNPVAGARVDLVRMTLDRQVSELVPGGTPIFDQIANATTDVDGKYVLRGFVIPENRKDVQVQYRASHFVGDIKPGEEQSGFNFRMNPEGERLSVKAVKE